MKEFKENILNKSFKSDLHMHTTASDGVLSPAELVDLAFKRGLDIISITDHDTVAGILPALEKARSLKTITLIPGIEINTDVPGAEVHMLGYFIDFNNKEFLNSLGELRDSRNVRARQMLEKLSSLGMKIEWEHLKRIAQDSPVGRPHVAQALVEAGYVHSSQEAFDKFIGRNCPAYIEHKKMTPLEVVRLIINVGGIPVLAHPDNISSLESLLPDLKAAGLMGMEVFYDSYSDSAIRRLLGLSLKYDLIPTGGSDYHGIKGHQETMVGDVKVPPESIRRLFKLAEKCNPILLSTYNLTL